MESTTCYPCVCNLKSVKVTTVTIESIAEKCFDFFNETKENLSSTSRKRDLVQMRQMCMFMCKEFTTFSLKSIGDFFGGRDHTTVVHALKTVKDLCENYEDIRTTVINLRHHVRK